MSSRIMLDTAKLVYNVLQNYVNDLLQSIKAQIVVAISFQIETF